MDFFVTTESIFHIIFHSEKWTGGPFTTGVHLYNLTPSLSEHPGGVENVLIEVTCQNSSENYFFHRGDVS